MVFHTPITPANAMGTALALAGVLAYSLAKGPEASGEKSVVEEVTRAATHTPAPAQPRWPPPLPPASSAPAAA